MQKSVMFVKKNLEINMRKIKNIVKLEIIVIIQGNKEVHHNGSNYDYHFIVRVSRRI